MKPATLAEAMATLHSSARQHGWPQLAAMYLEAGIRAAMKQNAAAWANYRKSAEAFARKVNRPKEPS